MGKSSLSCFFDSQCILLSVVVDNNGGLFGQFCRNSGLGLVVNVYRSDVPAQRCGSMHEVVKPLYSLLVKVDDYSTGHMTHSYRCCRRADDSLHMFVFSHFPRIPKATFSKISELVVFIFSEKFCFMSCLQNVFPPKIRPAVML